MFTRIAVLWIALAPFRYHMFKFIFDKSAEIDDPTAGPYLPFVVVNFYVAQRFIYDHSQSALNPCRVQLLVIILSYLNKNECFR